MESLDAEQQLLLAEKQLLSEPVATNSEGDFASNAVAVNGILNGDPVTNGNTASEKPEVHENGSGDATREEEAMETDEAAMTKPEEEYPVGRNEQEKADNPVEDVKSPTADNDEEGQEMRLYTYLYKF